MFNLVRKVQVIFKRDAQSIYLLNKYLGLLIFLNFNSSGRCESILLMVLIGIFLLTSNNEPIFIRMQIIYTYFVRCLFNCGQLSYCWFLKLLMLRNSLNVLMIALLSENKQVCFRWGESLSRVWCWISAIYTFF